MATTEKLEDRIPEYLFTRYGATFTSLTWSQLPEKDRDFWRAEARMLVRRVLRNEEARKTP